MPRLDQMNEQELIAELQRLAAECDKLDWKISKPSSGDSSAGIAVASQEPLRPSKLS